jgi:hypothetical protein
MLMCSEVSASLLMPADEAYDEPNELLQVVKADIVQYISL